MASVSMTALVDVSRGGNSEAFDRADRLFVQFRADSDVRLEQEVPFSTSSGTAVVRLEIPLRQTSEQMTANIELRVGTRALFRGTATPTLTVGARTPVTFTLIPVVASLACGPDVQISSYGSAGRLEGAALFATGDTVRGAPITWSAPSNTVATVSSAGDVTALTDGDVQAACSSSGFSGTRAIHVLAVVTRVEVAPSADTIAVRSSVTLTPTLRDAKGNAITSPRPIAWTTANASVASVNASGVVTGVAPGVARIDATSGTAVGSSQITVTQPSPIVTTNAATNITGTNATLNGTVNPNGTATSAWFEWSPDSTLAAPQSTTAQSLASGSSDAAVSETLGGLTPGTSYFFRVVASNSPGVLIRGAIVRFTTVRPPTVTTSDPAIGLTYTVRGAVNPNGSATTAWFQFATAPGTLDGPFTPTSFTDTPQQNVGSGTTQLAIAQVLSVQPFTTYFVRVTGRNVGGTATGGLISFTTGGVPLLGATTGFLGGSCGGAFCAQMFSSANPQSALTEGWFEFSSDSTFKSFSPTAHQSLGSVVAAVSFQASLSIARGQEVFFRAVASNALGTVRSGVIHAQSPIFGTP
jgi:hypothetical protein